MSARKPASSGAASASASVAPSVAASPAPPAPHGLAVNIRSNRKSLAAPLPVASPGGSVIGGGVKLPQILSSPKNPSIMSPKSLLMSPTNAAQAREIELEEAAKAAARKPKAALTPAEKRALKLRHEQAMEEAAEAKQLKATKLAEMKAARRMSSGPFDISKHSIDGSIAESSLPSGRQSAAGFHGSEHDGSVGGDHGDGVEFIEHADGSFSAHPSSSSQRRGSPPSQSQAAQDDEDEALASAAAAAEAEAKPTENFDIVFDGPKSPLIMATAACNTNEMMRIIQEVPIEYRVEFVNAYDDHGCSAIFFAVGPEHQDCLQLLLDYGADPNSQNNKKNGPLHVACAIQNKKSARLLIEHGANIQLENWQYQKPHEMVTERDKVSSTQAYLNLVVENFAEKVASKEVFGNITRQQRSYYRSMYDITDNKELGVLRYDTIEPLLASSSTDGSGISVRPDPKWVFGFFSGWDTDKNGVISFPEWMHRIVQAVNEKERLKKKAKKKQMAAAKRKSKKDATKKPGAATPSSAAQ